MSLHQTSHFFFPVGFIQQLLSPLSEGLFHNGIAESGTAAMDLLIDSDPLPMAKVDNHCYISHFLQPENAHFKKLVVEEYVGTGEDRLKNRESFTQVLGDLMFVVPAIKAANAHRDAGAPVYLYEYQHPPKFLQDKRPSFVKSDHGDEIFMVFGFYVCSEEEEQLSRTMMSYWGNFAYTGSPNGRGLVHWPKYGAKEEYLEIRSTEQVVSQGLKKDRFALLTQTLPETHGQTTDKEHSEL
uniref:Carboxylesterase type B domain-containing protein n=1 Tax=Mola mola TaxID=94237 RepID=A0A3Q3XI97_MOLML